ncbi:MAG: DUF4340 domain-containing protein [Myxococcota bacterium]
MNLRATGLLALAAAALGFWVWYAETGQTPEERREAEEKIVVQVPRDSVTRLVLPTSDAAPATLVRVNEGEWKLETPLEFPADEGSVEGILTALEKLEAEATIADPPEDLSPFGLGAEARSVKIERESGEPIELRLGGRSPIGADRYVERVGEEGKLFVVAQWKLDGLSPKLQTLRDKRILALGAGAVKRLRVERPGVAPVVAERIENQGEGATWRLLEPLEGAADSRKLTRLVQDLDYGRVVRFIDSPKDLAPYGLASPALLVELTGAKASERLTFGRAGGKVYLQPPGEKRVVEIPARLLDAFPKPVFGYRFKQVLKLDRQAVQRIELEFPRSEQTHAFVRRDGSWKPDEEGLEVESLKVDDLLAAVEDLEAKGIEETSFEPGALGLETPSVRLGFRGASGEELAHLELGDVQLPEGLAARSSQSKTVWRVDPKLARDVPLSAEAFQNRWVSAPAAAPAPPPEPGSRESESPEPTSD